MRKATGWLLLAGFAIGLTQLGAAEPDAGKAPARKLRHMVLYQFKDNLPANEVQLVIDAFAKLPSQIDTIIDFEHGANVSPEGKSQGLTHAFVVTFRDEAGRDRYLKHPAHNAYVEVVRDRRQQVVVFDYWTE